MTPHDPYAVLHLSEDAVLRRDTDGSVHLDLGAVAPIVEIDPAETAAWLTAPGASMSTDHPARVLVGYRWVDGDPGKAPPRPPDEDPRAEEYSGEEALDTEHPMSAISVREVEVISSEVRGDDTVRSGRHVVAIDVDLPVHLIESSPGHHHLIIERELSWDRYRDLLVALEAAEIIEPGYLGASLRREFTCLRRHPTTPTIIHPHPTVRPDPEKDPNAEVF